MSGIEQAKAQYESIVEMVEDLERGSDPALETIQEDALSVQVRSDWTEPGQKLEPYQFELLLCTGGPAVRIIGTLNEHNEPETAKLEHSDWFKGWTEWHDADEGILLTYSACFWYGE